MSVRKPALRTRAAVIFRLTGLSSTTRARLTGMGGAVLNARTYATALKSSNGAARARAISLISAVSSRISLFNRWLASAGWKAVAARTGCPLVKCILVILLAADPWRGRNCESNVLHLFGKCSTSEPIRVYRVFRGGNLRNDVLGWVHDHPWRHLTGVGQGKRLS